MFIKKTLYALGDVTVVADPISEIRHRGECNIFYDIPYHAGDMQSLTKSLPIFGSPMASVINKENFEIWLDNGIIPILPRTETFEDRKDFATCGKWAAFSMEEFERLFCDEDGIILDDSHDIIYRALIDIANGHIKYLQDLIKKAKECALKRNYTIEIMAGNVANPETYRDLSEAGADYVRCSVGSGNVCFIDGTKITLANGEKKNIEDINIGDIVKTHDKDAKITNVIRFKTKKEMVTINNEVTCTSEHKFYVINKKDKDFVNEDNLKDYAFWIEAKNLNKDTHLLIKKY